MDLAAHPDSAAWGHLVPRTPLVRRLLARNPSPFTFTGTGTFVVGHGTVAVIDPGPADPAHIAALLEGLAGETVSHILVTHTHMDHSPAAPAIKAATGAQIIGCAPLVLADDGPRADAGFDPSYAPDAVMAEGDSVSGPGWTLTAVATPGHTSNHLCFALAEESALFTGDHVMGWSTTVVAPPDGNMTAYMASLRKLLEREDRIYHPTHGEAVTDPQRFVRGLITHRKQRETQILKHLAGGPQAIPVMVAAMYSGVDKRLHPAAGRSVLAHLFDLQARGLVVPADDHWTLA
ncbi:MBL fold metallo-hydrolase [Polymorphobacter multimanifer]|uniref:Glyoxylase-like metal-dependent hydrolase (Beta-lactamase superfamily II) n=1 Tax=Polymorphobacter multimanifer TaxID=1070431 RepID=A0A841L9W7_9SPHN|nr:MBL fold metallo-hydrolase [Polymorphobacter multimanifer]MBB6226635.1 glyoxylase-like metal-dependent hydrolase (beta-lactamase superfamily II) [Polymorphobacter multimanifer]GGI69075.1 MBL fold metallo-hydrolase [Polymorphobacter multimanifer]